MYTLFSCAVSYWMFKYTLLKLCRKLLDVHVNVIQLCRNLLDVHVYVIQLCRNLLDVHVYVIQLCLHYLKADFTARYKRMKNREGCTRFYERRAVPFPTKRSPFCK